MYAYTGIQRASRQGTSGQAREEDAASVWKYTGTFRSNSQGSGQNGREDSASVHGYSGALGANSVGRGAPAPALPAKRSKKVTSSARSAAVKRNPISRAPLPRNTKGVFTPYLYPRLHKSTLKGVF